ncbi:MAG: substrate-binding domain-containing protein [Dysgonamonadaceae bacterium]|nr:substrate-binding domain-containing protein [Dysgonamonadaceae bacterium]
MSVIRIFRITGIYLMMKRLTFFGILGLWVILIFSCKQKNKDNWTDTMKSGFIYIASDESFKSLMDAEIQSFEAHNNEAFVNPIYVTEKQAIQLLTEDSVRLAVVTRDLYPSERAKLSERNMNARKFLIAFDGIALIMNRMNPDSIISVSTLQNILTGQITEWSQINPQSNYGTIRTILDNKESGVLRYVADSLLRGETNTPNIYALNSNIEVIEKVMEMPNSIGILSVNVLNENSNSIYNNCKDRIRMMRLSKEDNATIENSYLPYAGDINQDNYPLWRPVYVLLSDPRSGLSSGFTVFLAGETGQKVILRSGLLSISDPHVLSINVKSENPYK